MKTVKIRMSIVAEIEVPDKAYKQGDGTPAEQEQALLDEGTTSIDDILGIANITSVKFEDIVQTQGDDNQ